MGDEEEGGTGGALAKSEDIIAQYQTARIRAFWTGYKRIFQLTQAVGQTLDPSSFKVTNTFPYDKISLSADEKNSDQVVLELDKTTYVYKTAYRSHMLCQMFECITKKAPSKLPSFGPFDGLRLRKNGVQVQCQLFIVSFGIVEQDIYGNILQEYKWVNILRFGADEQNQAFFFEYSGRTKIFYMQNLDRLIQVCKGQIKQLGMDKVPYVPNQTVSVIMKYRLEAYSSIPAAVSVFDVNKYTRRSPRPLSRQLHISEEFVTEMDASGFQFVSFQPVSMIYALVRSWDNPRQFTIEYNDGSHRKYTCSTRDTLLAMLLDVCHAAGNVRVIVTGEISDGHRLMPRFAEEEYQASMKDAFFGADSIEMWFLKRLQHACKHSADADTIISACRDLNANVPCPGISANSDPNRVKAVLIGVLKILQDEVIRAASVDRLDNSRGVAVLLQTLYRLIPSTCGYKAFVEVKEVDTRVLLLQLLKFDNNFVNYWTLEVLLVLCKCPLAPRNMQQEFVNKHSVLTTTMLKHLLELMSYRIDIPEATSTVADDSLIVPVDSADASSRADSSSAVGPTVASAVSAALGGKTLEQNAAPATSQKRVATNPSAFSHIPAGSMRNNQTEEKVVEQKEVTEKKDEPAASTADLYFFTPNSLVVIGAAQLLESIVSSRKDTTSPELLKEVLDLLAERYDILVSMLRSTSFLILENAAILMFCLLKNRPMVATGFKEMVLCDALVLKHFYNAIFSPSGTQRFLSRFLIATWLSGSVTTNPGKALLTRMIPSGLVEYLKFGAISEEHRQNLDSMEDDFYANFANSVGVGKKSSQIKTNSSAMQQRMRKRIATALREQVAAFVPPAANMDHPSSTGTHIPPSPPLSTAPTPAPATNAGGSGRQPENYRVMFHMMTQSHKLPDLIWNDQTRLELRNALESEIKSFEREQRLRGTQKIAWNFQQFSVRYESLREEIQVGPIYIRYFLEAGTSFLRQLQNPPPDVFFEKLFRRVLVNIQFNANLAILCTRCITQLYEACRDLIGSFDDMAIVVRMLEQASNLELQQHLLDLLISLCQDDSNLLQLLDKGFVDTMIKYVSLAHINPDQIGNVLARATNSMLLIKDADNIKISTLSSAVQDRNSEPSEEAIAKQQRRSLWVPDDGACPKVWFAAPMGQLPPPKQAQKGPYRVSELLNEYESGHINDSWLVAPVTTEENDEQRFEALVDTGRWKRVEEYFQLRLQLLYPGKALYSPAQVASKCLMLLLKLAAIHKSSNFKSIPFYPIAMSKRIMSESTHLSVFAQLLLSNDPTVVDNAADLLRSLVEFNLQACSKLYLTGVYFFAARYTGNNYIAIANFFHSTHLRQSFHDSSEIAGGDISLSAKSVLGSLFPPAMICILNNYGSERFAGVQTGDFDTPEVIWNAELRRHLVEMVEAHLGDFSARLRQHSLGTYEYCPIPKIHYQSLDRELYVHEYYLRNLCDEMRFPDWPIGEPLLLLRECLERWREEMTKGIPDSAVSEAKKILSLPDRFDNADLRKAYKNLARQYHPDKNPAGRDMFEKIQKAYELLSSVELQVTETDLNNVLLLIKTQIILYRRFPGNIGDQKYPAYSLLVEVTKISSLGVVPSGQDAELLVACTRLMYYTTHVSPLNVREFVKSGAVAKLYGIIEYAMSIRENIVGAQLAIDVLVPALKTFTSVANIEEGRAELIKLCPKFSEDVYSMLSLRKSIPLAVENAIEIISRCCSSVDLQTRFIEAGVIWRLVPLLLEYDSTLKDDYSDESQRTAPNQCAYNMHAVLAAKALGRLGGYMFEDLSSPPNDQVKQCLANLLTGPLAKLLRNRRPWDLLESLNQSVEACTRIWNVGMRSELMEFALKVDRNRPLGSSATDLQPANDFKFTCLRDELCVGGVYVRIFNKSGDTSDIDDPSKFCGQLIDFIYSTRSEPSLTPVQRVHLDHAVEGLKVLSEFRPYVPYDIAKHEHGVAVVFGLLEMPPESSCFVNTAHLLTILFNSADFVSVVSKMNPPIIWKLLKCLCTVSGDTVQNVWTAAEALVSSTDGLTSLLEADAVIKMLAILIAVPGCVNSYQCRLSAISLLSKCLWNPVKGADVSSTLRRFLPEPVVVLLRGSADSASLQVLDTVCENPELIWTAEMQSELRSAIRLLMRSASSNSASDVSSASFIDVIELPADFSVQYRQLANELYVGGVYIRIYLKQPTFRLSNPVFFMEKLMAFWESSFNSQVPTKSSSTLPDSMSDSRSMILGKEDFLSLLTSCIILVIKGESSVIDHMLSWGFASSLCDLLMNAQQTGRIGSPFVSILRILHHLVTRVEAIESIGSAKADIINILVTYINTGDMLPKDSTIAVELLKKLYQCNYARCIQHFVQMARRSDLPNVILNRVLTADSTMLSEVVHPSALRIYAVDILKAMLAVADEDYSAVLQALLDAHPAWREYKEQSHDLFITDKEKTDLYLIQDSSDKKFAGLLTDGTDMALFSSTGPVSQQTNTHSFAAKFQSMAPARPASTNYTASASAVKDPLRPASVSSLPARPLPLAPSKLTNPPTVPHSSHPLSVSHPVTRPPPAPAPKPTPAPIQSQSSGARTFTTTIHKGEHGIGLDLGKNKDGLAVVLKLKVMPAGIPNPASTCTVPLVAGDIITAVNGVQCGLFSEAVRLIRACESQVVVTILRS